MTDEQSIETDCPDLVCTRRRLLVGAGAVAGLGALELANPTMAFAGSRRRGDLLVVVNLEGGADGLSLVPPLGDRGYLAARPGVAVTPRQAIPIDRSFGLHPGLKPLLPYWRDKRLAIVHAVGDSDGTRSHFEAINAMDRGVNISSTVSTGWIDRHLVARGLRSGDFPALAIKDRPAGALAGRAPDLSTYDVQGLRIRVPSGRTKAAEVALAQMYSGVSGSVAEAGRTTLSALSRFAAFRDKPYAPRGGAKYPTDHLGHSLSQVARVARAGVGLEVACVTGYGWDTHEGMGSGPNSYMNGQVSRLGQALAAFAADLGPLMASTTIVTMSEFGRRVTQNGSNGLDHGHGSAMLVMGGGIRGGKVYGRWPGLGPSQLDEGDLRVTTDYRDVLGELVRRRLGGSSLRTVFPDYRPRELGLARHR
jgi:uncharacterized protein (DUF1501 family)